MIRRIIVASLMVAPIVAHGQDADDAFIRRSIEAGSNYTMQSKVLAETRELNVWLPTDYATSKEHYPVIYLLDGGVDQDFGHIAALGQLASLSWTYGPVIIVGVATKDRSAELTGRPTDPRYIAAFPKSGGAVRFRRYLREEVVPFIDSHFRTGKRRALMGESLAGLFVVDTLLSDPTLFNDYVAISPSLWWDDRRPLAHLDRTTKFSAVADARLYLAMADEGGTMQVGVDQLRSFLATRPAANITVRYADFSKTATHSTVYHRAAEEALRWLYPAPPYDYGPTPWYMIEGASPPLPVVRDGESGPAGSAQLRH
jgi:predicted alpha/beta superfamily hydrolase